MMANVIIPFSIALSPGSGKTIVIVLSFQELVKHFEPLNRPPDCRRLPPSFFLIPPFMVGVVKNEVGNARDLKVLWYHHSHVH